MEQKNDGLLPCQKETALENIEASMNLYDMPEHQDTIAVDGWALSELVDEVKRWRLTHSAGEFSPDYCAAGEALTEHLEHCPNHAIEKIRDHIEEMRKTANYDWNADPLYITRIEGWLHEAATPPAAAQISGMAGEEVTPEQVGEIMASEIEWWRKGYFRDLAADMQKHGLRIVKDKA